MKTGKVRLILSILFLVGYVVLLIAILIIEASDSLNMEKSNSFMLGLSILLGALTAGVGQLLNFWFSDSSKFKNKK